MPLKYYAVAVVPPGNSTAGVVSCRVMSPEAPLGANAYAHQHSGKYPLALRQVSFSSLAALAGVLSDSGKCLLAFWQVSFSTLAGVL